MALVVALAFCSFGCGGGSNFPTGSQMAAMTPTASSVVTPAPSLPRTATGSSKVNIDETGTVADVDLYGRDTPMITLRPAAPYGEQRGIDVYMKGADHFHRGQKVAVDGTYMSYPPNSWINATSITLKTAPSGTPTPSSPPTHGRLFDHVTVVIMENHNYDQIIGNADAAYINALASSNALFTDSHAVGHPSEPNYLALYSGSTQGVTNDDCPLHFFSRSLGGELTAVSRSIKGYFEDLPSKGSTVCQSQTYWRKHNPLIDFNDTPPAAVVPYPEITADLDSNNYPAVAFVIPNQMNDMHDGSVAQGDKWLATNLARILDYDNSHDGLLVLTWDESDYQPGNQIATIFVGPMVKPGRYSQRVDHYSVLRTITDNFGLSALNAAGSVTGIWR